MANYKYQDIIDSFKKLGLKKGDRVFTHSNLGFFGKCEDAKSTSELCEKFFNAFREVIGEEGTLIVPTFTYSFCKKNNFDPVETDSSMGIFSEYVRKLPEAVRSLDANFSVAAVGRDAKFLTENMPEYSFGKNSFWDRFRNLDGKFLNLNFDSASTYIHYVERELQVPYRWDKPFVGTLIIDGELVNAKFYHFVYDLEKPNHVPNFSKFDNCAKTRGIAKTEFLGKGSVLTITANETFDLIKEELEKDKSFLIKGEL